MKIGIVGCGGIARAHVNAYQANNAELVAFYDSFAESAKSFSEELGGQAYDSIDDMIASGIDAVSICTPPVAHTDNVLPFLDAGIPVLCEKPIELNGERAAALTEKVNASNTLFMTAFCHRFHPPVIKLKEIIDSGELGDPILLRNFFGGYMKLEGDHRIKPEISGGGCMIDHSCHAVDLFRFLVGEPTTVSAVTADVQNIPIEDLSAFSLKIGNSIIGSFNSTYSIPFCRNTVEWMGSKGSAVINYSKSVEGELLVAKDDQGWTAVDCADMPERFTGEITYFLDCVKSGTTPSITANDGLAANRIVDALYLSEAENRIVKV
ncbi:MAG: Gfo/Idh/MocA family oxidoreductase [Lentisphaeria bacterium]|nr:Gfo/Idh/MocA family oxidoreductase [Lentisphaeria bacterium]NQZ67132.1 Gfo/Idh/MocA family oxidoreductase [Lentisphaeria bacterium]